MKFGIPDDISLDQIIVFKNKLISMRKCACRDYLFL